MDTNTRPSTQPEALQKDFIFGTHPVLEALKAQKEIDSILVQREATGDTIGQILQMARLQQVPIRQVPLEKLDRVTRKAHQGVIAFVSPVYFASLPDIISHIYEQGQMPFVMLLDQITDVRNFGALIRTAECAGVQAVVVPQTNSARIGADAMKTSAGALNLLPICREKNLLSTIRTLQESGLKIVACTEKASDTIFDVDLSGPLAFVLGSEETGIQEQLLRQCDHLVQIPMAGKIESLNVSVAAGVCLFEALRQRRNSKN